MNFQITLGASSLALALGLALFPATAPAAQKPPIQAQDIAALVQPQAAQAVTVSVLATGLYNPRGLKFGPDGYLYVAEGGKGGTHSTIGKCAQVIPPIGPYTGSATGGRISRISRTGVRTTVTSQLPSSQTSAITGALTSGVADIAFIGNTMYALIGGAGCSHGVPGRDNAVVRIGAGGTTTLVANLSAYQKTHPVKNPEADDFEPDGTWWSMVVAGGNLYAVEPNHGELDRISPTTGAIHRVSDISASQGHIVPTALQAHYGNFFVGNLNTFPVVKGSAKVLKITPTGQVTTAVNGLTTVLGLQFDKLGRMYVLQATDGSTPDPSPATGSIVRIVNGAPETIVSGLTTPTGMVFGPDGDLYVSNVGFGAPPLGLGQVLRIHLGH
ncbi:ScyD/ScyE family protein [Cognatiluteimonas profundi]|uniref:ScyD/ScyE family protein n=1 Tax=Cognatiluteimonas profundi TaxID=2594501 RepID=UPI00131C97B2|nr:ScyD/ScyE family protein [Lysobacter profundi]